MREPTEQEQQQYQRMVELSNLARQRYLEAGGDPHRAADESFLSTEEKAEFLKLGRRLFGVHLSDAEVVCQGRSWSLTPHPQAQ
ncbi:hypothetical protein IFO70_25615 [Phormidium tenue FACHB-886]|nr:hypothetical protein [Phormidium tenue FACHB-886]